MSDYFESLFCFITEQQVDQMKLEYVKLITRNGSFLYTTCNLTVILCYRLQKCSWILKATCQNQVLQHHHFWFRKLESQTMGSRGNILRSIINCLFVFILFPKIFTVAMIPDQMNLWASFRWCGSFQQKLSEICRSDRHCSSWCLFFF